MTPLETMAQEVAQAMDHHILMLKILVGVCFFNCIIVLVYILHGRKK